MNNKIEYTRIGDYNIPNLILSINKYSDYKLGKYGKMRLNYLKVYLSSEYRSTF